MSNTIPGKAMFDQLLARAGEQSSVKTWFEILATAGHKELFTLIAVRKPQSIRELSEFAGRAQSNVSRSLSALVESGLVKVSSSGRVSVPSLTELGREKAKDELLIDLCVSEPAASEAVGSVFETDNAGLQPLLFPSLVDESGNRSLCVNAMVGAHSVVGTFKDEMLSVVSRLLDDWWRILYRRDAPYKVGVFLIDSIEWRSVITSTGTRVEHLFRPDGLSQAQARSRWVSRFAFEKELLDVLLKPVVDESYQSPEAWDLLLASKLVRLQDSINQPAESVFCRTAGALSLSPYDLSNTQASLIRDFVALMPDEDARLDFASIFDASQIATIPGYLQDAFGINGNQNTLHALSTYHTRLRLEMAKHSLSGSRPWQKGIAAAKAFRKVLALADDRSVGGLQGLAKIGGAEHFTLGNLSAPSLRAFQTESHQGPNITVQYDSNPLKVSFSLARAMGDYLVFQDKKACVSEKYTERQALGRAFAAEFMAPAEGIIAMIDEEQLSAEAVAAHYAVSPEVVRRQYNNNSSDAAFDSMAA